MKYRIKMTNNDITPFKVQRKNEKSFFSFWRTIVRYQHLHDAERFIRRAVERHAMCGIGSVVYQYDETDLVADRLKNQKQYESEYNKDEAYVGVAMEAKNLVAPRR